MHTLIIILTLLNSLCIQLVQIVIYSIEIVNFNKNREPPWISRMCFMGQFLLNVKE